MKSKFKIMYPEDHWNEELRGTPYLPSQGKMVVMNGSGVFFLYDSDESSMRKLSDILHKYDVVWK